MIITITKVETAETTNGNEYRKVTGTATNREGEVRETTKSVLDNLKDKWPLLVENATLEFKMEKKGQFWNVIDIKPITREDLPAERPPPEPIQKETGRVDTARVEQQAQENQPDARTLDIHRQVAVKEIGELWRCGHITEDDAVNKKLIAWYMNWIYKTVGIGVHYK